MDHEHQHELAKAIDSLASAIRGLSHNETISILHRIEQKVNTMAATLDQVLKDVEEESTVIDSISELVKGLKQQLADALAGTTLPPAVQAKVDAVFAQAEANKAKLADALVANTPSEP